MINFWLVESYEHHLLILLGETCHKVKLEIAWQLIQFETMSLLQRFLLHIKKILDFSLYLNKILFCFLPCVVCSMLVCIFSINLKFSLLKSIFTKLVNNNNNFYAKEIRYIIFKIYNKEANVNIKFFKNQQISCETCLLGTKLNKLSSFYQKCLSKIVGYMGKPFFLRKWCAQYNYILNV